MSDSLAKDKQRLSKIHNDMKSDTVKSSISEWKDQKVRIYNVIKEEFRSLKSSSDLFLPRQELLRFTLNELYGNGKDFNTW